MDQLITIERVPIKIEYVETEAHHSASVQSTRLNISCQDHSMTIQSDPISIPMTDTFQLSSSDCSNLTYTATAQYSSQGNLSMSVKMHSDTDSDYQYQQFDRSIDNIVDHFPPAGDDAAAQKRNDSGVLLDSLRIDFDMSGFFNNISGNSSGSESVDTSFYPRTWN